MTKAMWVDHLPHDVFLGDLADVHEALEQIDPRDRHDRLDQLEFEAAEVEAAIQDGRSSSPVSIRDTKFS
jgi:hypothetical protein